MLLRRPFPFLGNFAQNRLFSLLMPESKETKEVIDTAGTFELPVRSNAVIMGCVCYRETVPEIWTAMKKYFQSVGLDFDFVLFTTYEQQVRALLEGEIDIAWNGPFAHVMTQELANAKQIGPAISLGMRDVDRDFPSVVVVRKDTGWTSVKQLAGQPIMAGARDSPQGNIVPLYWLQHELHIKLGRIESHDLDLGRHGDTGAGELKVLERLAAGDPTTPKAAVLSKLMWTRALEGRYPTVDKDKLAAAVHALSGAENTPPCFDHCQFDTLPSVPSAKREGFAKALFAMDMCNPKHAPAMKLEGVAKEWKPNREQGYDIIRKAMKALRK
eukprot:g15247.t1